MSPSKNKWKPRNRSSVRRSKLGPGIFCPKRGKEKRGWGVEKSGVGIKDKDSRFLQTIFVAFFSYEKEEPVAET